MLCHVFERQIISYFSKMKIILEITSREIQYSKLVLWLVHLIVAATLVPKFEG